MAEETIVLGLARAVMGIQNIYVLKITHVNGVNVSVHLSPGGAERMLASYCREWANHEHISLGPGEQDDDAVLIDKYFNAMWETESFEIDECQLLP